MNEKFLNKFFKIYSIISYRCAKKENIEPFLISSYYKDKTLLYLYEYIDFELWYSYNTMAQGIKSTLNPESTHVINYLNFNITNNKDIAVFLYKLDNKIKNDLQLIVEKDVVQLNEYYKKIL